MPTIADPTARAVARTSGTADDKLENGRYMLESANNSRMSMD